MAQRDANLAALLSLFLLLLAFFILLTSISLAEKGRIGAALSGVTSAFRGEGALGLADGARAGLAPAVQKLHGELAALLPEQATLSRNGLALRFSVAPGLLFNQAQLRPSGAALLQRIAEAVRSAPPGVAYAVEVLVPAGERALVVARAGLLARTLEARGLPASALAIGVAGDGGGDVTVGFLPRRAG